ncbi:hypothetical protein [Planomonospora sphaerica]|uniref:hypothetical protein n=1 Tax=Planomonospora sphaerica TaxID=161355 RepID=UPI00128FE3AE|nr:hypothetical protein [Planomonospora sphaerica]
MTESIVRVLRGLLTVLVVCTYMVAVFTLVWLTESGRLGDGLYGSLVMIIMAFPLSLVGSSLYGPLKNVIIGQKHTDPTYGWNYNYDWEYLLKGWPGVVTALLLAILLTRRRTRPVGRVMSWALTAAVTLTGVVITFDGWAPRQPYGWPFLVYGLVMAIGVIALHRSAPKGDVHR